MNVRHGPENQQHEYAYRTSDEIAEGRGNGLVVIPSGAVEIYGPHLPLGSDSIVAQAIARAVAVELDAQCAPLIPVGYSGDLMGYPGTLTVPPEAFKAYLTGVVESFMAWGYRDFLFVNTHAGNVEIIHQIADRLTRKLECRCLSIDWWRFSAAVGEDLWESGELAVGHAAELGTSVLLHLAPELVHREREVDFAPDGPIGTRGVEDYLDFSEITPTGVLGQASLGSAEKGKAVVERSVQRIVELAQNTFAKEHS